MANKVTPEGMNIFLPSSYPLNMSYAATGAGDDPVLGVGKGAPFIMASDPVRSMLGTYSATTFSVTWSFRDACFLAGGGAEFENAVAGDTFDLSISCPASTATPALNGTGNCNLIPISQTTKLIVPAPNGGDWTLQQANPVPAYDSTPAQNFNGLWEWGDSASIAQVSSPDPDSISPPNVGMGSVVPTAKPGSGSYNLLTSPVVLSRFMIALPMIGSHARRFTPMLKPKRILPHWTFTAVVANGGHIGLRVAWYLEIGRASTV